MAIPHLNRMDEVLHELFSCIYDTTTALAKVRMDAAERVSGIWHEHVQAAEAEDERVQQAFAAERERTIKPLCERLDACAQRIDAVDAYVRSISSSYRQERSGALSIAETEAGGYTPPVAVQIGSLAEAADAMQQLAAQAEQLRDQIVDDCKLPRILQNSELVHALGAVVDEACGWYVGVDETVLNRENERIYEHVSQGRGATVQEAKRRNAEENRAADAEAERLVAQAAEQMARILTPRDIELLDELADLSLAGAGSAATETLDFLMLGWLVEGFPREILEHDPSDNTPDVPNLLQAYRRLYGERLDGNDLIVPLLMDRSENCSIAIAGGRQEVLPLFASIAYQELAGTCAGLQRFVVIDGSGYGAGLAQALPFIQRFPGLADLITEPDQARAALRRLADEARSAAAAGGSILDFIERTGGAAGGHAPLTTVLAIDLPGVLDPDTVRSLCTIAELGGAAGVNLVVSAFPCDPDAVGYGQVDTLRSLPDQCVVLNTPEEGFGCWSARFFPEEPAWETLDGIGRVLAERERAAEAVYRGLGGVLPPAAHGAGDARDKLSIPFALAPDGAPVALEFGDAVADGLSHFALATGTTGTGKSSLLHAIILSGLLTYSPAELELYLLDFKQGVEFEIYRNYRLPHVRVVALDADQAFGVSVLDALAAELERRARLYQELGVTSYAAARAATNEPLPRVLVVLDEFQVLLNEATDRRAAARAATILRTFFQTARAFGMHFILTTQALSSLTSGCSMGLNDFSQVNVRIGLNNSEAEHQRLFGEAASARARRLMGAAKGSGVYLVDKDAAEPAFVPFRFCYIDKDERPALLEEVAERYAGWAAPAPFVYCGSDVPALSSSAAFAAGENDGARGEAPGAAPRGGLLVYLGEPARMGARAAIEISRVRRSTVLAASSDPAMADRLQASYLACACWSTAQAARTDGAAAGAVAQPAAYVLDAHLIAGDGVTPATQAVCRWAGGHVRVARSTAEAVALLDELAGLVAARKALGSAVAAEPPVHVIVGDHALSEPLAAFVEGRDLAPWREAAAATQATGATGEPFGSAAFGNTAFGSAASGNTAHRATAPAAEAQTADSPTDPSATPAASRGGFDDLLARLDAMRTRLDADDRGDAEAHAVSTGDAADAPGGSAGAAPVCGAEPNAPRGAHFRPAIPQQEPAAPAMRQAADGDELRAPSTSALGSPRPAPSGAPRVRAGSGLMAELIDRGHVLGINVCLATSDYLALKDLRYSVLPKMAWRVVHDLSDDQAHFIIPDVNPAALRRNIAVLWDGAHPAAAFKPYRVDAEHLPPLP